MQLKKVPLADTHAFTPLFLDYLKQEKKLQAFSHRFPSVNNAKGQLAEKSSQFSEGNRKILAETLERQYKNLKLSEAVQKNISALRSKKTFTITTGHQLNIFTGPMYFIFKIVTVVNACRDLKKQYPEYDFVPVYWMASEDHDYDEIKYFRLYGKKYTWNTNQTGAVGRFSTKGFDSLLKEVPGENTVFNDAYLKHKTLAEAVRYYVNALFGKDGVVVIDADDRELKSQFKNVIREDVIKNTTLPLVDDTNKKLEAIDYKTQVFCRNINFFYLDDQLRSRIEKNGDRYNVVDSNLAFSEQEINKLIDEQPEKFSPNVILRPLYQEVILPNIAYVGGPAEVVYWMQLKSVFEYHKVAFPMLMPRNFGMVIENHVYRKFEKTGLELPLLFEDKNFLFNHWTLKNSKHDLTVGKERNLIQEMYDSLRQRAEGIDKTLGPFLGAEGKRALDSLEHIEKKMLRAEKRLQNDKLNQIAAVKDALFPNGGLQERTDNFLNFYQKDPEFIDKLLDTFDPFDFQFHVIINPE
jgi:bacillithiol biosynthesis cysteine-adding enzyme BshC